MKNFQTWKNEQDIDGHIKHSIKKEEFLTICKKFFDVNLCGSMKTHHEYLQEDITEAVQTARYSIEVNYRTDTKEALEGFAKICLGYVSAALKKYGYHTKHVFSEKPLRLLISSRNWDDGEWVGVVTWHPEHNCFVVSKGFYNKDRKTVSVQNSQKCKSDSASDLAKDLQNMMHHLKNEPDKTSERLKLRPAPLKRGPKT